MDTSEFKTFEHVVAAELFVFTMTAEDGTNPWLCAISDLWDLLQPSKWLEYGLWNFDSVVVPESEIEDIEALVLSMMAAIWIRFAPRYVWSAKHHAASVANPSKSRELGKRLGKSSSRWSSIATTASTVSCF